MPLTFCLAPLTAVAWIETSPCAHFTSPLRPCDYEDSANCFWDATTRGNQKGESFIDVNGERYTWIEVTPLPFQRELAYADGATPAATDGATE